MLLLLLSLPLLVLLCSLFSYIFLFSPQEKASTSKASQALNPSLEALTWEKNTKNLLLQAMEGLKNIPQPSEKSGATQVSCVSSLVETLSLAHPLLIPLTSLIHHLLIPYSSLTHPLTHPSHILDSSLTHSSIILCSYISITLSLCVDRSTVLQGFNPRNRALGDPHRHPPTGAQQEDTVQVGVGVIIVPTLRNSKSFSSFFRKIFLSQNYYPDNIVEMFTKIFTKLKTSVFP